MRGRLAIAFPYLFFGLLALVVVGSHARRWVHGAPAEAAPAGMAHRNPGVCPIHGIPWREGTGYTAQVDGAPQKFCNPQCEARYRKLLAYKGEAGGGGTRVDPVCKMQVSTAWGVTETYEGQRFYFCTERCRILFARDPGAYVGERCPVCNRPVVAEAALPATYLGRTYYLCSEEHRARFKKDPAGYFMHTMWGIPTWLYYASIAGVLLVSFWTFEGAAPARARPGGDRLDLLRWAPVRRALRSRPFRFACQLLFVAAFVLILAAGLFGDPNPALNVAPLLTWTIWWCGLVVVLMFAGKAWCYVCPWDAIATWMERRRLWRRTDEGLGLGLPWPRRLRNIWVATALFVGLTWVELGFGVTMRPAATAYLGLGMLVLAIVAAFLFEGKSFCRYGCLVGRVSGLYALFSAVEVRPRDRTRCRSCRGKPCVRGSETAYGCPTFENPSRLTVNTYCIQCTECLQACPHDNLAVNLRPWGADLAAEGRPAADEAYLALLMLSITGFHGLTMTPTWPALLRWLDGGLGLGPAGAFTAGMAALMGVPVAVYALLIRLSHLLSTGPGSAPAVSYRDYFVRYAYCVLPIALFYHLAHNLEHLLMEGPKIVRLLSDPLGRGWNLFGTAHWSVPPLVSLDVLWLLQVALVAVGHVYSLWAAQRISRRLFSDPVLARRGQIPVLVGMIAFSVLSLWLLKQPMEMRTSAM
ncbi:MAG: hypothetical protein Kow0092_38260 [Deferrisomatales bacterium]